MYVHCLWHTVPYPVAFRLACKKVLNSYCMGTTAEYCTLPQKLSYWSIHPELQSWSYIPINYCTPVRVYVCIILKWTSYTMTSVTYSPHWRPGQRLHSAEIPYCSPKRTTETPGVMILVSEYCHSQYELNTVHVYSTTYLSQNINSVYGTVVVFKVLKNYSRYCMMSQLYVLPTEDSDHNSIQGVVTGELEIPNYHVIHSMTAQSPVYLIEDCNCDSFQGRGYVPAKLRCQTIITVL